MWKNVRPDLSNTPPNFYVRFRAAINLQAGEEGDKMDGIIGNRIKITLLLTLIMDKK